MSSLFESEGLYAFQLLKASDPVADRFGKDGTEKVAQVVVDAVNRTVLLDGRPLLHTYWNAGSNSLAWDCPDSKIPEGQLSFNQESNGLVGLLSYSTGERVVVTGEPAAPPPDYDTIVSNDGDANMAEMSFLAPAANFMANFTAALTPNDAKSNTAASTPNDVKSNNEEEIDVTVYTTERLLVKNKKGNPVDDEGWEPYHILAYGVQSGDDLALAVFLGEDDISSDVDTEHGREMTLFKSVGDPKKKERDYTFRVVINPGVENYERTFEGTFEDRKGEYKWRGKFFVDQKRKKEKTGGVQYGPDGKSTRQGLLMISSITSQGEDIAQKEGDRIYGKILIASIPDDAKAKLYPDAPKLDKDEEAIKNMAKTYLERAAVVNLLSHFANSDKVDGKQRSRINMKRCEAFNAACMAVEAPTGNEDDPVVTHGWSRTTDEREISDTQNQAKIVALHCYRLGYVRSVGAFQPYLKDAAYWYKRLVDYIEHPIHLRQFTHRVKSQDDRIERDVYDWHTKLTLLHNVCGDQPGVSSIDKVMQALKGASQLATLDNVEWNDEFKAHLKVFFEELDKVHNDPLKSKDAQYMELQKLMAERGAHTWSEVGKSIIDVVEAQHNFLHRKPTVTELADIIAEQERVNGLKGLPKYFEGLKAAIRPAIIMGGMYIITKTLMGDSANLSVPEQISMYLGLVEGCLIMPSIVLAPLQFVAWCAKGIAKGVGWCLKKLLPTRSLGFLKAAKAFGSAAQKAGIAIKGLWKTFSKGIRLVFGFFVSCFTVWAAAEEFVHALDHGRTIDKWFAGTELVIAAASCLVLAVQFGAALWGTKAALAVVAFCGTLGMVLMGIGLVLAVAFLIVTAILKEDPVKDFIDKYGGKYHLLK